VHQLVALDHHGLELNIEDPKDDGIVVHLTPGWQFPDRQQELIEERALRVVYFPAGEVLSRLGAPGILSNVLLSGFVWSILDQDVNVLRALVGDVSPLWQKTPSQGLSVSFSLTCPSATTCYVSGPGGVEVARDAGKTWVAGAGTRAYLSAGLEPPYSPVTCVSVSTCAVISGSASNGPLFMETADAGRAG
jgi:hypothetical protein